MATELDPRLLPMCSHWEISFIGPEKKTSFNHVLQEITAERTVRFLVKAIRAAGGKVLRVSETKKARCTIDVSSKFGVKEVV